jgi:large subunit ribosomal protein L18
MDKWKKKRADRIRRHRRIRKRVCGTPQRPRLAVFRSSQHIYAQIIDDEAGRTLASASSLTGELREQLGYGGNVNAAKAVGELLARRATEQSIKQVVLDRGGCRYHGRVKALADAAREGGLEF